MAVLIDELYVSRGLHQDLITNGFSFIYLPEEERGLYIYGIDSVAILRYDREGAALK